MKDIDMLYIVEKNKILFIKDRNKIESVVCEKLETMEKAQKDYSVRKITESRLAFFALNLLEKMKLINNSIIINYEEYITGAE